MRSVSPSSFLAQLESQRAVSSNDCFGPVGADVEEPMEHPLRVGEEVDEGAAVCDWHGEIAEVEIAA
jgi:hypothetical protein